MMTSTIESAPAAHALYAVQKLFQRQLLPGGVRFVAKRMNAKTIEVKASDLSLISQSDAITKLILEATGKA
jgi:hypothetical protein